MNRDRLALWQDRILLQSYEGEHLYHYNGSIYFSPSSVLKVINAGWEKNYYLSTTKKKAEARLKETAHAGHRLHQLIHDDCMGLPVQIDLELEEAFLQWRKFKEDHRIVPLANEVKVCHEKWGCAGTADILCEFEGQKMVADFKTGRYGLANYQLACYRESLIEMGVIDASWRMGVFSIHRDGSLTEAFIIEHNEWCWRRFLDALGIWKDRNFSRLRWLYAPADVKEARMMLTWKTRVEWEKEHWKEEYQWDFLHRERNKEVL